MSPHTCIASMFSITKSKAITKPASQHGPGEPYNYNKHDIIISHIHIWPTSDMYMLNFGRILV